MNAKPTAVGLDWSRHKVGDPRPCRICRRPALMRDANGIPCHKVCAETANERPATPTRPHLQLIEGGRTA
ncbi:hypothetical protein [Micromonospora sp. NPDC023956]|uniref:hypothetical protein n=1 Tax=Micromonospora sp. NPDC023956 TaxID=3155722 RepID=UPI0033FCB87C